MKTHRYVALLRGINVGGNNIIPMAELRACFTAMGFTDVATLIQSGNVVFTAGTTMRRKIVATVEQALSSTFSYSAAVTVLSADEIRQVVEQAPRGFGSKPESYRYDVMFPLPPTPAAEILPELPANPKVDMVAAGEHAIYYRRLIALATRSKLSRIISLPVYRHLTVRNWNTTTKLHRLANPD
jgi:uncharacterized protein (DUF1697 family)